jgi:hypothetical protein
MASNIINVPSPPQLTGDWQVDYPSIADYLNDLFTTVTQQMKATANYCDAINTALGNAHVSGFPITPPTS